uniref:Reverse transcriptase domain-containing protein n=1 Tax=Tanacetum cinerariifolium TaxID=118510 RepID=A0A6L2J2E7_TANCI|nr:reverse transcriptase domain-containing protein [Tanacetum cinerariifolium]
MEPRPSRVRKATLVLRTGSPRVRRHRGRVVEFEKALNRDGSRVEKEFSDMKPLEQRVKKGTSRGGNLTPLLAAHLGGSENGQPLQSTLTSEYGGNQPSTNLGGNLPPNSMYLSHNAPHFIPNILQPPPNGQMPIILSSTRWTKMPFYVGPYDGKGDPDNYLHLFESAIRIQKWAMLIGAKEVSTNRAPSDHREGLDKFNKGFSWDNNKGRKKNKDTFSPYKGSNHGLLANLSKSLSIKKGKVKTFDTQLGEWKKGDKDIVPVEAPILMVNRESYTLKRKYTEEPINEIGEIIVNRVYMDSDSSCEVINEHCFLKIKPSIKSLRVDSKISIVGFSIEHSWPLREKIGNVVSTLYAAIKFHTPCGIGTVFSTYEANKVEGGQKKVKENTPEVTKDILSCVDTEEKIIINDKHREQTIFIGKHLPTNFKRKPQDLLLSNADVFAWTYADMTGILRIFMGKLNKEDMLMDIQETFDRIQSINMKLNSKMCSFAVEKCLFLGHLITKKGIKANPSKFKAITDLKPPRTLKEIHSLNGKMAALSQFLSKGAYSLMLVSPEGKEYTYALRFKFETINNEAKYEALLAGLRIAIDMKIKDLTIFVDSQLVSNQVQGLFKARQLVIKQYLKKTKEVLESFDSYTMEHVQMDQNKKDDALRKLASMTFSRLAKEIMVEVFAIRSIVRREARYKLKSSFKKYTKAPAACMTFTNGFGRHKVPSCSHRLLYQMGRSEASSIHNKKEYKEVRLRAIVCRFRVPKIIISNNGKQFSKGYFLVFCQRLGIYQSFNSVYHPQANRQVEVKDRDIIDGMERRLGKNHQS